MEDSTDINCADDEVGLVAYLWIRSKKSVITITSDRMAIGRIR
jgi:hypothetical protein